MSILRNCSSTNILLRKNSIKSDSVSQQRWGGRGHNAKRDLKDIMSSGPHQRYRKLYSVDGYLYTRAPYERFRDFDRGWSTDLFIDKPAARKMHSDDFHPPRFNRPAANCPTPKCRLAYLHFVEFPSRPRSQLRVMSSDLAVCHPRANARRLSSGVIPGQTLHQEFPRADIRHA